MESQEQALDEIQWRAPDMAQGFGGIHENTVLYYFAKSPFFDPTSNNATLETQALYNPSMAYLLETRDQFEGHLKTMQGIEFMVAQSARDYGREAPIGQGMWVIRKQNRRKRPGMEDEVTILATYFVIGENIYMAPSVSSVVSSKMLSTTLALNNFFKMASSLPKYTSALGHRYFPVASQSTESTLTTQQSQKSKEGTPMPESQSQSETTKAATAQSAPSASSTAAEAMTLFESFNQFLRYGNEYMNENPLVGEPGSFVFSSSKQSLQQQAAQRAQQQQAVKDQLHQKQQTPVVQSEARNGVKSPSGEAAALQLKTEIDANKQGIKASDKATSPTSVIPKVKRRKSRAPTSPSTPVDITSPSAG